MISYSSLGKFREVSVKWAASRRFSRFPPSQLPLAFVFSHSSHPTEGIFSMHHTFCMCQVRYIAPIALSTMYGPVLTSSE